MTPLKVKRMSEVKRLERNLEKAGAKQKGSRPSALKVVLWKAKSVFDHAGSSNDLWMAKKYIDKALELLEEER